MTISSMQEGSSEYHKTEQEEQEQELEDYDDDDDDDDDDDCIGSEGSDPDHDSVTDPSYSILEETHTEFSNVSIRKKPKSRIIKDADMGNVKDQEKMEMIEPKFDEKSFERAQKMIEAGQIEKLKLDQCKVYLRKHGLRLTGNKATLNQRIKEHQEILNGGVEQKYPVSSFALNCTGDACTGDVVMFEQNVYEMYNIASRSANGPPCGTRIIAGRIVKESYGAAKQQHTFTIEVLWSSGVKPLPPLHPLLIKGRNLYRLKTLRQRWEDEGERHKILMEKHSRGSLARSVREIRIQEKEKRNIIRANRVSRKESANGKENLNSNSTAKVENGVQVSCQPQLDSTSMAKVEIRPQQLGYTISFGKVAPLQQSTLPVGLSKPTMQPTSSIQQLGPSTDLFKPTIPQQQKNSIRNSVYSQRQPLTMQGNMQQQLCRYHAQGKCHFGDNCKFLHGTTCHRQPLTSINQHCPMIQPRRQGNKQQQLCQYHAKGKCHFGDNCKFLHEEGGT
ncbi:zf-CCCH domain-containing protein/SAP domain-containing protein [Cephalotus follicularis]|uniref:Zf-CCCH domain-containing protein/SAP domain-containing protein n=1 Tax=Cephalotus follicularis TaxID=3775 RepID=A0A1Q3B0I7_CEPFO|nr:zf-CCCH domain-containing protein/SAP domain-containing protein [Cephalotus follicularis]